MHPGPHEVEHDVAGEFEQVSIFLYHDRLETPLEDVPHTAMSAVKALGINPIELAHTAGATLHQPYLLCHTLLAL